MITTGEKLLALWVNRALAPIAACTVAPHSCRTDIFDDIVGLDGAMAAMSLLPICRVAAVICTYLISRARFRLWATPGVLR